MEKIINKDQDIRFMIEPEERGLVRIPVTRTLSGSDLSILSHVIRGAEEGPTLAIFGCIHGDETGILPMLKKFMELLNPSKLCGTIIVVPIVNPLALSHFSRFTPEQHGNIDLHTSFPGSRNGCITQMIANAVTENILKRVDALVDIHSGGMGGRLQYRVDFDQRLTGEHREKTIALCKAFGAMLIHENDISGSASALVNKSGVPTVNIEIGGSYLGPDASSYFDTKGTDGLLRITHSLNMVKDSPVLSHEKKFLLFDRKNRIEVNPSVAGFLESNFQKLSNLSQFILEGTLLGRVIDPYTLETIQELVSPVDGYLFFSRFSGVVEAGSKAFGIAKEANSTWL